MSGDPTAVNPRRATLFAGPRDGAELPVADDAWPDHLCQRTVAVWHHYAHTAAGVYRYAGECVAVHDRV